MPRPRITTAEKIDLWRRWKHGESLTQIARALARSHRAINTVVRGHGGVAPPPRRRDPRALTLAERERISRGVAAQEPAAVIGRALGRPTSTVTRELARNGGRARYRATRAEHRAWRQARRPKRCRLAACPGLAHLVAEKLQADWSPEQIAGWLRVQFADDAAMQISHETIYRTLFIQARGALKQELVTHLRRGRALRRPRRAKRAGARRGAIVGGVSIRERPADVADRAVPGHWEGDLVLGNQQSQVATLVERTSRFLLLVRVPRRDTNTVVRALTRVVRRLPKELMKSLTWDRGAELADHQRFVVATDVHVFFCDPHSPWQRGTNENTNGIVRQYLPKGTDLSNYSQAELNLIARKVNTRPRKTLGYATPADKLAQLIASTG